MKALFGYPGGKKNLVSKLLQLIPAHDIYLEPFCGAASLLFAKVPSRWEILNDIDEEILNFFRVAKFRPAELAQALEQECVHISRFRELEASRIPQDECQRALRFFYLTKRSFGSKRQHFASVTPASLHAVRHPTHSGLADVRQALMAAADRLRFVLIERRDFAACIARWDSKATFFYCDPPYVDTLGADGVYPHLSDAQHHELARILKQIKGKFLLSYNDCPLVRRLYGGLRIRRLRVRRQLPKETNKLFARELLISNYFLPRPG